MQNEWSKYGSDVQKFIPLALTLPVAQFRMHSSALLSFPLIRAAMDVIDTKVGNSDFDPLLLRYFDFSYEQFGPATKLLCQILTDFKLSMTGHDFDDQVQYTQLALFVAESILPP